MDLGVDYAPFSLVDRIPCCRFKCCGLFLKRANRDLLSFSVPLGKSWLLLFFLPLLSIQNSLADGLFI